MPLVRWCSRLAFFATFGLWIASCAGGGEAGGDDLPPAEGEGGEGGDAGEGGSGGAGKGGAAGKSGSSGGTFPSTSGNGGAGGSTAGQGGTAGSAGAQGGSSGGGMGGGAGGTFPSTGSLGSPCTSASQCTSNLCVEVGHSKSPLQICTQKCMAGEKCPAGYHCATIDQVGAVCTPDRDSQCGPCSTDTDCKNKGDRCLASSTGQPYCSQDCAYDGNCPAGYECKTPPGAQAGVRVCTLVGANECPCAPNRDKTQRPCKKTVGDKICAGQETCNGAKGQFEGCTAPDPSPEVCDGKDNDCDGKTDNPPGATCNCSGGTCTIQCQAGFVRYPADLPESDGCPCALDAGEPDKGSTCATPLGLSTLADTGAKTTISISGTLSSDTDVDWYKVRIDDNAEVSTNTYHARIAFEANPDNEFVFQVIRGEDCTKEATAPTLTSYDVCVNYQDAGSKKGLLTCADATDNVPKCQNMGAQYLIAVKRSATATKKTCGKYTLKIDGNAGSCDPASFDACGEENGPKP